MGAKRRHHVVPNFYLKGFTDPSAVKPKVWIYEKGKPYNDGPNQQKQNPKLQTTKSTGWILNRYKFTKQDGTEEKTKYEDILAKEFEQPAIEFLTSLRDDKALTPSGKERLSVYLISMILRGKLGQTMLSNRKFERTIERRRTLERSGLTEPEINSKMSVFVDGLENDLKTEGPMNDMIVLSEVCSRLLLDYRWMVLLAPSKKFFPTSDRPVLCPTWNNLHTFPSWFVFPICSRICLLVCQNQFTPLQNWIDLLADRWLVDDHTFKWLFDHLVGNAFSEVYYCESNESLVDRVNELLSIPLENLELFGGP
ncbi:MAG: DUF4238 domain-containing protein [Acidobacteria bacterium]|nr:DUF4238 domain-containing protein [Acidobacteriota bacterium]MCW5950411.1 DUF4238 domain-containing protein [Pyrinomonadaceae bacterium]